jgi:hypothetical protein
MARPRCHTPLVVGSFTPPTLMLLSHWHLNSHLLNISTISNQSMLLHHIALSWDKVTQACGDERMSCYDWPWSKKSPIHFLLKLLIVIITLSALCLYTHVYICHHFSYYNSKFWFSHVNGLGHVEFQQPICEVEEILDKSETSKATRGSTTWLF